MTQDELRQLYAQTRTIAVVGASGTESKPAYQIPDYLRSQGYRILPVNPRGGELYGQRVFRSTSEIEEPVDVVDVFRPPAEAAQVAEAAIGLGARVLWFQPGTESAEAVRLAEQAGLAVVTGRCMGETHARLGLGPGPRHD